MGSLKLSVRNKMLNGIDGTGQGTINYIELIETQQDYDFGRHAISWGTAVNGVKNQSGTITIVEEIPSQSVTITGFKFYESTDEQVSSNGSGTFTEPITLEGGNEYTINVSGIKIELPE